MLHNDDLAFPGSRILHLQVWTGVQLKDGLQFFRGLFQGFLPRWQSAVTAGP